MQLNKILKYIAISVLWLIPAGLLAFTILLRSDVFKQVNKNQPFEMIADMDNGKALKPQSGSPFFANKGTEALRPVNSIPRSGKLYSIAQTDVELSVENGENPLPKSALVYRYGKHLFNTNCVYCHNTNGDGRGAIITKMVLKKDEEPFPGPPDIRTSASSKSPDSRLFHILSAGQNLMYPVGYKLTKTDRWAVIRYFRTLQGIETYVK